MEFSFFTDNSADSPLVSFGFRFKYFPAKKKPPQSPEAAFFGGGWCAIRTTFF
jgi:hypothetical protein